MTTNGPPIRQSYIVGQGKLVPESYEANAQLASIPLGEKVDIVIFRERNPKFDGLVYSTFGLIGEAMKWRIRNVRGWIAIRTGRCDLVKWPPQDKLPKDHIVNPLIVPHGTGPSDMGRGELEAFWDDAREVIRKEIMPHIDPAAAEQIGYRIDETRDDGG